jgi:anti-sigma-K factor RskA
MTASADVDVSLSFLTSFSYSDAGSWGAKDSIVSPWRLPVIVSTVVIGALLVMSFAVIYKRRSSRWEQQKPRVYVLADEGSNGEFCTSADDSSSSSASPEGYYGSLADAMYQSDDSVAQLRMIGDK